MIHHFAPRLLRRHVRDSAQRHAFLREHGSAPCQFGQAEIHDLHLIFFGDHDVGAFDVPMRDAFLMRGLQAIRNLHGKVDYTCNLQHATCYLLPQALSFDVLHRNEHLPIDFIDRVNGANVGMIERRRRLRLTQKAILLLAAERDGREKLHPATAGLSLVSSAL